MSIGQKVFPGFSRELDLNNVLYHLFSKIKSVNQFNLPKLQNNGSNLGHNRPLAIICLMHHRCVALPSPMSFLNSSMDLPSTYFQVRKNVEHVLGIEKRPQSPISLTRWLTAAVPCLRAGGWWLLERAVVHTHSTAKIHSPLWFYFGRRRGQRLNLYWWPCSAHCHWQWTETRPACWPFKIDRILGNINSHQIMQEIEFDIHGHWTFWHGCKLINRESQ